MPHHQTLSGMSDACGYSFAIAVARKIDSRLMLYPDGKERVIQQDKLDVAPLDDALSAKLATTSGPMLTSGNEKLYTNRTKSDFKCG
jgi:hypothetical protein